LLLSEAKTKIDNGNCRLWVCSSCGLHYCQHSLAVCLHTNYLNVGVALRFLSQRSQANIWSSAGSAQHRKQYGWNTIKHRKIRVF